MGGVCFSKKRNMAGSASITSPTTHNAGDCFLIAFIQSCQNATGTHGHVSCGMPSIPLMPTHQRVFLMMYFAASGSS